MSIHLAVMNRCQITSDLIYKAEEVEGAIREECGAAGKGEMKKGMSQ